MYPVTKDFLGKPAPPNYVAGLGRGAAGFTTRSDIGPAREGPSDAAAAGGAPPGRRRGDGAAGDTGEGGGADSSSHPGMNQDPDNETGLFANLPYGEDDEEADRIYASIDAKMDERRKRRREDRERVELEELQVRKPKIHQQFADLKQQLADVSVEEWANLPDVGDLVGKHRSKGRLKTTDDSTLRYTPISDSALMRGQQSAHMLGSIGPEDDGALSTIPSSHTPLDGTRSNRVDLVEMGQARTQVLSFQLDKATSGGTASGVASVDPRGYITGLDSMAGETRAGVASDKQTRALLQALTTTNPQYAPGWISAAQSEERAGKLSKARSIIMQGCEACPLKEEIWLEAARLHPGNRAKAILADAVRRLPQSVNIWLQAMRLENDPNLQRQVIRKALEMVPNSVKLWKTAVSLEEDPANARVLLARAVELVPLEIELWLALARLESYDNARKVLNRARKALPTNHEIWLAGAKLEEQQGDDQHSAMVGTVVDRAVHYFSEKGSILKRGQWLEEAERCESEGFPLTSQAIVRATMTLDVDPEDRETTWLDDAEKAAQRGAVTTARALYAHATQAFPAEAEVWLQAAYLEKQHGTPESLDALLKRAVKYCPHDEIFWLMGAKEQWLAGHVDAAREILGLAFDANPDSERIWLAAIKLEMENREFENARLLLAKARERANTAAIWMKSVLLERITEKPQVALQLLDTALTRFPTFAKLWMMQGQIYEALGQSERALESYRRGTSQCPTSVPLWLLFARLEEHRGVPVRARALLERGRLLNPQSADLWLDAIRLEARQSGPTAAATRLVVSKALQECPSAGQLWAEAIFLEPRPQRKTRSVDAMKKCHDDPHLMAAIARLFWSERKNDKARVWFQRAAQLNGDIGDTWAWWYKFESEQGTPDNADQVRVACAKAEPHHGDHWQPVAKDIANFGKPVSDILQMVADTLTL